MSRIQALKTWLTWSRWVILFEQVRLALIGAIRVLVRWQYLLVAAVVIFIFSMIFGVLSVGTSEWNMLTSSLPLTDKVDILVSATGRTFKNATETSGALVAIVVVLQGLAIALLVFTTKQQRKFGQRQSAAIAGGAGQSAAASLIATLGLGCSACGTSLIVPLLSIASGSAVFLGVVATAIVVVAIVVLTYSSLRMGYSAYILTEAAAAS